MSISRQEKEFLKKSNISVHLPSVSYSQGSGSLEGKEADIARLLNEIPERTTLFFDERLRIYVNLRLPEGSEERLKACLSRLDVHLEIWAVDRGQDVSAKTKTTSSTKELLEKFKLKTDDDPLVMVSQSEEGDDEQVYLELIWEAMVTIKRPRIRLFEPHVVIIPHATVRPVYKKQNQEYLTVFEAQEENLLQPLQGTKGLENSLPYLPASMLQGTSPQQTKENYNFHIKSNSTVPIRTYSAALTKLRFAKTTQHNEAVIASLEIEFLPAMDLKGTVVEAKMSLNHGLIIPLTSGILPVQCQSRDCIALLYQLKTDDGDRKTTVSINPANLKISVDILLEISEMCQPSISMEWVTSVDFSQIFKVSGNALHRTSQTGSRPTSMAGKQDAPLAQNILQNIDREIHGLSISFTADSDTVKVGSPFSWSMFVVNNTQKTVRLAVIPLPRLQRTTSAAQQFARRHAPKSSVASTNQSERAFTPKEVDTAPAFLDENVVYAVQHSGTLPPEMDLLSLTPEVRIGPLGPSQCHESEIKLVAFKAGVLSFDAVRVVDLVKEAEEGSNAPGVITDVRELPDIFVEND